MYFYERAAHSVRLLFGGKGPRRSGKEAAVEAAVEGTPTMATATPVPDKEQPIKPGPTKSGELGHKAA